jgi:hypothetical protein
MDGKRLNCQLNTCVFAYRYRLIAYCVDPPCPLPRSNAGLLSFASLADGIHVDTSRCSPQTGIIVLLPHELAAPPSDLLADSPLAAVLSQYT